MLRTKQLITLRVVLCDFVVSRFLSRVKNLTTKPHEMTPNKPSVKSRDPAIVFLVEE
jgi:hypothetical protein